MKKKEFLIFEWGIEGGTDDGSSMPAPCGYVQEVGLSAAAEALEPSGL
ncbi:MAG: hypothetical protein H0X01_00525 [Nitrospira sp.]|nr:hypothetical protein [Nitrospira sp.]